VTDSDGDNLYYIWDWGDGNITDWFGPFSSGERVHASHVWSQKGAYEIRVKLKDVYGQESDWSDPHVFNVYELKKTFLAGFITDLNDSGGDIISFKAMLVWYARFNPFIFGRVIPNEELFILKDYQGYLGPGFVLGMLNVVE
jgi:hypothetical protein